MRILLLPLLRLDPPHAQLPVIEGGLGVREGGGGVPGRRGSSSGSCFVDRHRRRRFDGPIDVLKEEGRWGKGSLFFPLSLISFPCR